MVFLSLCWEFITICTLKHYGVKHYISSLSKNHIDTVDTWSKLEEMIRNLNSMAFDHMKNILSQHFLAMAPKMVGIKYSSDIVLHAFGYYATSQIFYNRLGDNFQSPSLATLGRMTSKVLKLKSFLLSIFNTLNTSQNGCIILHNEVYIKKCCYIMANNYLVNQLTIHLYLLKQYLINCWYVSMGVQSFLQNWFQFKN